MGRQEEGYGPVCPRSRSLPEYPEHAGESPWCSPLSPLLLVKP